MTLTLHNDRAAADCRSTGNGDGIPLLPPVFTQHSKLSPPCLRRLRMWQLTINARVPRGGSVLVIIPSSTRIHDIFRSKEDCCGEPLVLLTTSRDLDETKETMLNLHVEFAESSMPPTVADNPVAG